MPLDIYVLRFWGWHFFLAPIPTHGTQRSLSDRPRRSPPWHLQRRAAPLKTTAGPLTTTLGSAAGAPWIDIICLTLSLGRSRPLSPHRAAGPTAGPQRGQGARLWGRSVLRLTLKPSTLTIQGAQLGDP